MLDCLFGVFIGLGLGAYNKEDLIGCFDDTFHLTHQQAAPHLEKAKAAAAPYAAQVGAKLNEFKEQATGMRR